MKKSILAVAVAAILISCGPKPAAVSLFNGKDLNGWTAVLEDSTLHPSTEFTVEDGAISLSGKFGYIRTEIPYADYRLNAEWRWPDSATNSGIFLQDMYEIQVLDCYNNETYVNGQTGSVYKQTPPLANAMRKPGEWNVYDIIYSAPIFKEDGTYRVPPRVTVIQNGIVLQNNTTILGTTEYIGFPKVVKHGAGPIRLQSHGDPSEPISFRNIWIREM